MANESTAKKSTTKKRTTKKTAAKPKASAAKARVTGGKTLRVKQVRSGIGSPGSLNIRGHGGQPARVKRQA